MDSIGAYKIVSTVQGGRRPLYLATGKDGARVAIKTAPLTDLSDEEKERFRREAKICSDLDHPNLLRVVDSGETPEMLYQVMEYLEGSDFSKVFASGRAFSWAEKLTLMEAVCDGLQYAHARQMVHRDIKPANIFLQNSGAIKLLDFGMARTDSSELTRAGTALGTLNYMAPEQVRGETCTPASDVFAAGIVFQQLCTGQHPFAAKKKSLPEILSAILFEDPPIWATVAGVAVGAPEGLEHVLRRALEKDPAKRWQSAGELRQALSLCRYTLENRPAVSAPAPSAATSSTEPPPAPAFDPEKTVVMSRPSRPASVPAAPPPVVEPPPPPRPPAREPVKLSQKFCPSCAHPNAPDASVCVSCGRPFDATAPQPREQPSASQLPFAWIATAIAVLLLIVLLLVVSR